MKEMQRVVETIKGRIENVLQRDYEMIIPLVPEDVKSLIEDALSGAYASGFSHGLITGESNNAK